MTTPTRRQLANAIRFLAADAVEAAKSGHPGMPMGMADIAEVLWNDYLQHNPSDPHWANRDRFVLSNGHGSMLHYALLHLSGYELPIEELKNFRQLHSKTAGHPERHETPGVETTTGPLGQGFANAVGFALAEKLLAQRYNREGFDVVDHRTWVLMGDGCMMEGISHEAASLAGTWGLGKLTAFWDDNGISIDGEVHDWFTDDTPARFEAYGWHVVRGVDGHDPAAIKAAIDAALAVSDKPSLICCKTVIGFGAPHKAGKEESHGAPLGKDELEGARQALEWPYAAFEVPEEIYAGWRANDGKQRQGQWQQLFDRYAQAHPDAAAELARRSRGELPADFAAQADAYIAQVQAEAPTIASRKASQNAIGAFAPLLPEIIGGSADLAPSNLTQWKASKSVTAADAGANYVHYGVREFGMSAIANGIALHGGFLPFDATFLVFSDYARNALRMSALIPAHVIHVYTHDSIGLGEDGPTHQPVEHLATLRYIPNNDVWRPCDAAESAVAWKAAILRQDGPSCLVFSRQNLPHQPRSDAQLAQAARGGYVLADAEGGTPDVILIGTGSEVSLAVEAKKVLDAAGLKTRVVSMPSTDVFDRQDAAYRESVLPKAVRKRVAVEAGVTDFWRKYVGLDGAVVGLDRFGASAPAGDLYKYFNITTEAVVEAAKAL
ncbi:transketolase [Pseudoxanthomonas kaohsiungensis]|uniref:Transketolase n=1 Tax=Pseudoxanthomonas kaohsiungensis TaxID=283923 RepID=A0ABW3LV32_9GAMM|nr:transketolase [Pseudoxanthomonas kaohsiungensis]KAF1703782.1 transketolase [Pseudoxanthomonas kaohsiungensis]